MKKCTIFLILIAIASSCVPVKRQTLLQSTEDVNKLAEGSGLMRMIEENNVEYRLQAGDVIQIRISSLTPTQFDVFSSISDQQNDRLDPILTGFLVDKQGYITMPHLGKISVLGLSIAEVTDKIESLVDEILDTPTVYVRLVTFSVAVLGEVENQGRYSTFENKLNVLEAVGMAGGLTEFADGSKIKIVRTENGVSGITELNVLEESLISSNFYYVKPNDIIIVPALKTKNFRQNQANNIGLILSGLATIASVILVYDRLSD